MNDFIDDSNTAFRRQPPSSHEDKRPDIAETPAVAHGNEQPLASPIHQEENSAESG